MRINEASDTSNFYWFHLDHLGGTHKVTRGNGEVATTTCMMPGAQRITNKGRAT
ncbi:MAG: hypothetical protein PHW11_01900 [Anaerolineaceae bacterium]|nr:hypothetical protein [Anaerolineaceae bacterium]MDD4041983.1 hypothetical protein [Anaerolineaceae bacterium]MDD4577448.1 hypothetical protein [Anaerolineaceae bacterium]